MFEKVMNVLNIALGPLRFAAKIFLACWRGLWKIIQSVLRLITRIVPPLAAIVWSWYQSRAVISTSQKNENEVNVDILHTLKETNGTTEKKVGERFSMSMDEFCNWDFSPLGTQAEAVGDDLEEILKQGDSISIDLEG